MNVTLNNLNSILASQVRLWRGSKARRFYPNRPKQVLQLYEFEACPYCRFVREVITELDLDVDIFPTPKGGKRFRPEAEKIAGKEQFPLLVDPNTNTTLLESGAIAAYLHEQYGRGKEPWAVKLMREPVSSSLASATRQMRGMNMRPSKVVAYQPEQPIELFSFESSPYSRKVRELLCELEIPYRLRSTGKVLWREIGPPAVRTKLFPNALVLGPKRQELLARGGKLQLPYLFDPNTGTSLYESERICKYLLETYAA